MSFRLLIRSYHGKARTNSGLLHLKLGKIHNQSQRTTEAVRDLEIAPRAARPLLRTLCLLGEVYSKNKDPRALEYLSEGGRVEQLERDLQCSTPSGTG